MVNSSEIAAIDLIKRSNKVLILPSCPVDGDSIGAAISLYLVLKKLDKNCTVLCTEEIPELLKFLPSMRVVENKMISSNDFVISLDLKDKEIKDIKTDQETGRLNITITPKEGHISEEDIHFNKGEIDYDLIITVDTAEPKQLGKFYENNTDIFHKIPVINIDHHISNEHFGKVNIVDIMAASTTELLLPLFEKLQEDHADIIDEDIATLLLTGIITDTGSFQNANTTPKAFSKAAQLIGYGARQQEIIQHIYKTKQLSQLKLWGRVLTKIQTDERHKIVWSVVSQQDFKDTESEDNETGDIIDELMTNAPGAEIIMLMKEKSNGTISVSLRTTNDSINASEIAEMFGGGGHNRAAGFGLTDMDLREAEYKVIEHLKKLQSERLGLIAEDDDKPQEPMIDVEKLKREVEQAEKATEMMRTMEHESEQPQPTVTDSQSQHDSAPVRHEAAQPQPKPTPKLNIKPPQFQKPKKETHEKEKPESIYKFED